MHLYKTTKGALVKNDDNYFLMSDDWNALINKDNLYSFLTYSITKATEVSKELAEDFINNDLLAPIGSQEVWAAGVTYLKSRDARMEESADSGAADCYQRVYDAERPELFFKSLPHRVSGHNQPVHIRRDSTWNVPEPELTLFINTKGKIQAYTIGNDMSSRSIEGENPLYLPQAKMYERSAALGPCLLVLEKEFDVDSKIRCVIRRNEQVMFDEFTTVNRMKRKLDELAEYLFREMDFEHGAFLMTGTCVVPPNDFTLMINDVVEISIDGIGRLVNVVSTKL